MAAGANASATPGPAAAAEILAGQVRLVYSKLLQSMAMTITAALVFVSPMLVFFPERRALVGIWMALIVIVAGLRLQLWRAYARAASETLAVEHWKRLFVIGAGAGGASWSFGPLTLLSSGSLGLTVLLIVSVMSVSAVALVNLAPLRSAMVACLASALLPTALGLWLAGGNPERIAAMVVVAGLLALIRAGQDSHEATASLIRAKYDLSAAAATARGMAVELEQLAKVAELTSNAVFIQDAGRRITWVNNGFESLTGLSSRETLGRRPGELATILETDPATRVRLDDSIANGDSFRGEVRFRLSSGAARWLLVDSHVMRAQNGEARGYVNVLTDLTESRQLSGELIENLALIDTLFETIPVPVVLKNVEGRYLRVNRAYSDLFGDSTPSVVGKDAHAVINAEAAAIHAAVDRELFAHPGQRAYEVHQQLAGGRVLDALISKATLVAADGSIRGLVGTVVDISTQKATQAALRTAKEEAEAASRAKSRFLANMSHELRTPLNAVIGAAQLLRNGGDDPAGQDHLLGAIQQSGANLLGLIENILDLSRIEAGELALFAVDFNLLDCAEAALATAAVNARVKGVHTACVVDPSLELWRHGDSARLRQILLNLLGNAVKFTERGEVVLRVVRGAGEASVRISIGDTGIGIGAASLAGVFEAFRQADDGANRRFGGSGLGLAIVRQLVEAMGGTIGVRSTLGEGSVFEIELDLAPAHEVPVAPAVAPQAVAYYEPHPASAAALEALLTRMESAPHRCRSADDLREWLQARAGARGNSWFLVAADAADSWDLVEKSSAFLDPARVIGMTDIETYEGDAARERFGLPRSIIKPVLRSALVSRLGAVPCAVGASAMPEAAAVVAPVTALRHHVLVVEDDVLNQTIVCGMLRHAGYGASIAADGAGALAAVARERFDLILMDWQMPDMDGLEVTRRLRAGAAGAAGTTVPIVALTANAFAEDRGACLAAGMNDFLTKPVLAGTLTATVGRWIGKGASAGSVLNPDDRVACPALTPAGPAVFDPAVLAELPMVADGSQPDYAEKVLAMFARNALAALDAIEAALATRDGKTLQRKVHSLKSSAGQVGALALAEEARCQEHALRNGQSAQADWCARLRDEHLRFVEAANAHGMQAMTAGDPLS